MSKEENDEDGFPLSPDAPDFQVSSRCHRLLHRKNTICLWAINGNDPTIHCYAIDVSRLEDETMHLRPIIKVSSTRKMSLICLSTFVTLGTQIYLLGGSSLLIKPSTFRSVFVLDTSSLSEKWKKGPKMISRRLMPFAWAINGKIYALGGLRKISYPFLEFLEDGKWKAARPFPYRHCLHCWRMDVAAYLDWRGEILMGSCTNLSVCNFPFITYQVKSDSWNTFDEVSFFYYAYLCRGKALVVDKILYWFRVELLAYDFEQKEWLTGRIRGFNDKFYETYEKHLFHLQDNLFCLLWSGVEFYSTKRIMHCIKFVISKRTIIPGKLGELEADVIYSCPFLLANGLHYADPFMMTTDRVVNVGERTVGIGSKEILSNENSGPVGKKEAAGGSKEILSNENDEESKEYENAEEELQKIAAMEFAVKKASISELEPAMSDWHYGGRGRGRTRGSRAVCGGGRGLAPGPRGGRGGAYCSGDA